MLPHAFIAHIVFSSVVTLQQALPGGQVGSLLQQPPMLGVDGGFEESSSRSGRQKDVGSSGIQEIELVGTLVTEGWTKEMGV